MTPSARDRATEVVQEAIENADVDDMSGDDLYGHFAGAAVRALVAAPDVLRALAGDTAPAEGSTPISAARTARERQDKAGSLTLAEHIAQHIDWELICLPGTERATIVGQILELDDLAAETGHEEWRRIASPAGAGVPEVGR